MKTENLPLSPSPSNDCCLYKIILTFIEMIIRNVYVLKGLSLIHQITSVLCFISPPLTISSLCLAQGNSADRCQEVISMISNNIICFHPCYRDTGREALQHMLITAQRVSQHAVWMFKIGSYTAGAVRMAGAADYQLVPVCRHSYVVVLVHAVSFWTSSCRTMRCKFSGSDQRQTLAHLRAEVAFTDCLTMLHLSNGCMLLFEVI